LRVFFTRGDSRYFSGMKYVNSLRQTSQQPRPVTRTVLPALIWLTLECTGEYLEDLVARMGAPSLEKMTISVAPPLEFDISEFSQFISRMERFKLSDKVHVFAHFDNIRFTFSQRWSTDDFSDLS